MPSALLITENGTGRRLDAIVRAYALKMQSERSDVFSNWAEYSLLYKNVRIIKRSGQIQNYRCNCWDARYGGYCRHVCGVLILEGALGRSVGFYDTNRLRIPGARPRNNRGT